MSEWMYGWASGCTDEGVDVWTSERMYGCTVQIMDEREDVLMSEWMYGWASGCLDERADVWMSEWMYGWASGCLKRGKDRRARKSSSHTQMDKQTNFRSGEHRQTSELNRVKARIDELWIAFCLVLTLGEFLREVSKVMRLIKINALNYAAALFIKNAPIIDTSSDLFPCIELSVYLVVCANSGVCVCVCVWERESDRDR